MNISDEIFLALKPERGSDKAGWIFPNGSIVPCRPLHHREVLPREYQIRYDELLEYHNSNMEDELASLEPDEHPAMHRFDPEGCTENDLLSELATAGYVRFGIHANSKNILIDIQCDKKTLILRNILISDLAAILGATILYWENPLNYQAHTLKSFIDGSEMSRIAEINKKR
jgi:hypothetical protein